MPLVQAPGGIDGIRRFSEDGAEFGIIDQGRKRIGHYRLLDEAPWFVPVNPPLTLSKGAEAQDVLIYRGMMVVAGHGRDGEALWRRDPADDRKWLAIDLPDGIRKNGKSVDAVYMRDDKLIAIDNVIIPKWILVYDFDASKGPQSPEVAPLKTHTTYESVNITAENERFYALHSIGINHGTLHAYISLLNRRTLKEVANWSWIEMNSWESDPFNIDLDESLIDWESEEDELSDEQHMPHRNSKDSIFPHVVDMKFCSNILAIAVSDLGVQVARIPNNPTKRSLPEFQQVVLEKLSSVQRFEKLPGDESGLYAVGIGHQVSRISNGFPPGDLNNHSWKASSLNELISIAGEPTANHVRVAS